ncbi:DNA adenine methylase [Curtobacterium albidum]|uniref:DNA adenine methylase n=1 Tax=Curtobacterium citreum TaxID=2036 RepID=P71101_9MICO|nr:DNA adenine methylase [Curtobacterium albidum]NUU29568.1 DNA adenine methylase [Curtobacterium albidum]BAA11514.1 methyltransferase [Curtobacterium albidum]
MTLEQISAALRTERVPASSDVPWAAPNAAVMRYPGSKWSLARQIVAEFDDHYHYVEPFFGSGAVFFSKPPVPHEILNDTNGQVVNLFRVLRDRTEDLVWQLEATPWSRDEYDRSHVLTGDDVEDARRFVVRCWQAHASDLAKKTGWKTRGAQQRAGGMSLRWQKVPAQLRELAWRLLDAEIENRDAVQVIRRHNAENALIYADPPYLHSVRTQRMYGEEMTDTEHIALLDALLAHKGPVVVSGYANDLYDTALEGWRKVTMKAPKVEKGAARTEVLWVKR